MSKSSEELVRYLWIPGSHEAFLGLQQPRFPSQKFSVGVLSFSTESLPTDSGADGSECFVINVSSDLLTRLQGQPEKCASPQILLLLPLGIDHLSHFSFPSSFPPGKTRGLHCPLQTQCSLTTSWFRNKE